MSYAVNLVPFSRRVARSRVRRRNAWGTACSMAAIAICVAWFVGRSAHVAIDRLAVDLHALEVQQTGVRAKLVDGSAERDDLLEQLRRLASGRRAQPWAHRLVELAELTPNDVFLTELAVAPPPAAPSEPTEPTAHRIRMVGIALDHSVLLQFMGALQTVPAWDEVELVRAHLNPEQGVEFELVCGTAGET